MLHITVQVETNLGPGHVSFLAKTEEAAQAGIEGFSELCDEKYEWYKITSIDTKYVDDETGGLLQVH